MARLCDIHNDHMVLEPSAGNGALALVAPIQEHVFCYELNKKSCETLREMGFTNVIRRDFLTTISEPVFDRVLMNPPNNQSIKHVNHALGFLQRGGRLVALINADGSEIETIKDNHLGRLYRIDYPKFVVDSREIDAAILVIDT